MELIFGELGCEIIPSSPTYRTSKIEEIFIVISVYDTATGVKPYFFRKITCTFAFAFAPISGVR